MRLFTTLTALTLSATSALALDLDALTPQERSDFRAEVRAYLLDNPEVLMEAIGILEQRQAEAEVLRDQQLAELHYDDLVNDGFSYVGGNPEGDVTIVEFIDYRCGFCRRAHPEVAELVETDGNIRVITKEFPILGEQSLLASRFAVATKIVAGDAAYKDISDALMALNSDVSENSLSALAAAYELDSAAIFEAMSDPKVSEVLGANRDLGNRLQISGTPTFVFGDEMVRGYVDLNQMRAIVEQERAEG